MGATQINSTTLNEVWRTEEDTDMFLALKKAASYPYRTLSHKLILLLSPDYVGCDSASPIHILPKFNIFKEVDGFCFYVSCNTSLLIFFHSFNVYKC